MNFCEMGGLYAQEHKEPSIKLGWGNRDPDLIIVSDPVYKIVSFWYYSLVRRHSAEQNTDIFSCGPDFSRVHRLSKR